MPLTDNDHVTALRTRLQNRLKEIDNERLEVLEMIRVLETAPKLLGKSPVVSAADKPSSAQEKVGRTLQNRNVTALVREYVESYERDKAIAPNEIVDHLLASGVKGKRRSLYSAVCVILKKETQPRDGQARLSYEKGVGYFKPKTFGQKLGQAPIHA